MMVTVFSGSSLSCCFQELLSERDDEDPSLSARGVQHLFQIDPPPKVSEIRGMVGLGICEMSFCDVFSIV